MEGGSIVLGRIEQAHLAGRFFTADGTCSRMLTLAWPTPLHGVNWPGNHHSKAAVMVT